MKHYYLSTRVVEKEELTKMQESEGEKRWS